MFDKDELPKKAPPFQIGQKLEEMSVSELTETIGILEDEIIRLKSARDQKSKHLDAAAALFAKKS